MKYLHAIKGSAIVFVILVGLVFLLPGRGPDNKVELMLTVATFLFSILAGFFMSRLNSRYNEVRELLAIEDARWLSLYKMSRFYGRNISEGLSDLIDKYYIIIFDFEIGEYYKRSARYFLAVYDELEKYKEYRADSTFAGLLDHLTVIEEQRNRSSELAREKLTKGQWSVLLFLYCIIAFSLFYLKVPELYSQIITVLLLTALALVLLLIRDLQNLRLLGKMVMVESGQEVLEFIGRMRYYNQRFLKNGSIDIPKYVKKYRLGLHRPGEESKFKVVERK